MLFIYSQLDLCYSKDLEPLIQQPEATNCNIGVRSGMYNTRSKKMMMEDETSATSQTSASLLQDRPIMVTSNIPPEPSTGDSQATLSDHHGPVYVPAPQMVPVPLKRTIRPREFNGDCSWRSYHNHFNRVAEINGWTIELKKTHIWINFFRYSP